MIRTYRRDDLPTLLQLVQAGVALLPADLSKEPEAGKAFVYDDGEIRGFVAVVERELLLYVGPESRHMGIGRTLMAAIAPILLQAPGRVLTRQRIDQGEARFFRQYGFEPIVDLHLMRYAGPPMPEPELVGQPYQPEQFGEYIRINNEAFYVLRQEAGLEPLVFPEYPTQHGLHLHVLAKRENIWLFYHEGQPMGLVELDGPLIETVAVLPAFQGRGFGRALTQFAVNRLSERGVDEVRLVVGEPNVKARQLYERLGFELLQVDELSRRGV